MKKAWIVAVILIIVLALGAWYFNPSETTKEETNNPIICAQAGETMFNDATGENTPCCTELKEISGGYSLTEYNADCVPMPGLGTICSNCGNDVCESWENKCNCQADCK